MLTNYTYYRKVSLPEEKNSKCNPPSDGYWGVTFRDCVGRQTEQEGIGAQSSSVQFLSAFLEAMPTFPI